MSENMVIALIGSAVVAAIISALVTMAVQGLTLRQQETSRQREMFAKALAACVAYREFPFAIRRRGVEHPEAERLRLSEAIREIQQQLAFFTAWVESESLPVGTAYTELVGLTRASAGRQMHDAWTSAAAADDAAMNVAGIDYTALAPLEAAYTAAVREHLSLSRRMRRALS